MEILKIILQKFIICPWLIISLFLSQPVAIVARPITWDDCRPWTDEDIDPVDEVARFDKRVFNFALDSSLFIILRLVIYAATTTTITDILLVLATWLLYYPIMEYTTGKTIAKYISQTRVVNDDLTKALFGTILKRNLLRLIPFEIFSFIKMYPTGWHDSLSGTLVVDDHRPADVVEWVDEISVPHGI